MEHVPTRAARLSLPATVKVIVTLLFMLTLSAGLTERAECRPPVKTADARARYIFLFIGDGMGPAQVSLGSHVLNDGKSLVMTSLPVTGTITTRASDQLITDSAAAGTALATGHKTTVGTISMAPNRTDPFVTIAEMARSKGMKTGIVSSVGIDDATPACFYAHNAKRSNLYDIATRMASSGFDYFAGGYAFGDFPENRARSSAFRGEIPALMRSAGYTITRNAEELRAIRPGTRCWAFTGYDSKAAMDYAMDRHQGDIDLAGFTREGIRLLDNPAGFFMMVEGGKIDWACHANDAAAAALDVIALDRAIQEALAFYRRHPSETLVVITADHECGGLTLGNAKNGYIFRPALLRLQKVSMQRFTEKVAAWQKSGTLSFTAAMDSVRVYYGLGNVAADSSLALTSADSLALRKSFSETMKPGSALISDAKVSADLFSHSVTRILDEKAGIGWTTNAHTAVPVPVFAIGRGAGAFGGQYDNTGIAEKIIQIAKLKQIPANGHSIR